MSEDLVARRARLLAMLTDFGIEDDRVLRAVARVPREMFIPQTFREHAYENTALPIGHGQTISQPQVVAQMTQALGLTDRMKVLEIGTGSGYQTAVLAYLCRRVYTIERHKPLMQEAELRLETLGLHNYTTRHGDGALGWPEQAPFDRIIVTAAADSEVPLPLLNQLTVGGIMVVPVARSPIDQRLLTVTRTIDGVEVEDLGPVRFVPLVSETLEQASPQTVARALSRLNQPRR
jgi:protein-L-isoaspartate(D-aspartate) O-methyltransferase